MGTITEVPFLAIILGVHQPTRADKEMLRLLYSRELGSHGDFVLEHFLELSLYGEPPTPDEEAVRRCVATGTKQVVVLIPRASGYDWGATKLRYLARVGVQFRVFHRP
jgi:hypothetical protein